MLIVLQCFERFALASQHFLYTLFELTASQPVWVLCLTTRCDVLDLLEKRVKSRFSQAVLYLTHPRTWEAYRRAIEDSLCQPGGGQNGKSVPPAWQRYAESIAVPAATPAVQ